MKKQESGKVVEDMFSYLAFAFPPGNLAKCPMPVPRTYPWALGSVETIDNQITKFVSTDIFGIMVSSKMERDNSSGTQTWRKNKGNPVFR